MELAAGSWPREGRPGGTWRCLMGFTGARRRGEVVALTLADVSLNKTDGPPVRLRSCQTDQNARGWQKGVPFGQGPAPCPPCARVVAADHKPLRHRGDGGGGSG